MLVATHETSRCRVDTVTEILAVTNPDTGEITGEIDLVTPSRTYRIRPLSEAEFTYWKNGLKAAHAHWTLRKGSPRSMSARAFTCDDTDARSGDETRRRDA